MAVLTGNAEMCRKLLSEADKDEITQHLETRYTILRLPALFFAFISVGFGFAVVNDRSGGVSNRIEVVRVLLSFGDRVDARDFIGKTLLHYAMGPLCRPPTTFEMADLCIVRAKEIGFALVDAQDRCGMVALHQAIMGAQPDQVRFLVEKHHADSSITDSDGVSSYSMTSTVEIRAIIAARKKKTDFKAFQTSCALCGATGMELSQCSVCQITRYCSRECQGQLICIRHAGPCNATSGMIAL